MSYSRDESWNTRGIPPGRGPYDVGCGDVMTDDTSPGILLRLFYPIDKSDGDIPLEDRPPWLPSDDYARGYAYVGGFKMAEGAIKCLVGDFKLPARWHGQLSGNRGKYPVVVFSHGLGGCRATYTSTCLDIASCGCVVAAIEHRDNSACHSFLLGKSNSTNTSTSAGDPLHPSQPEHEAVDFIAAPYEDPELRLRQITQRRNECIAGLEYLDVINDGLHLDSLFDKDFDLSQFEGRLDMTDVAICGHSYGAATTIATLSKETRFKCGVACDPWGYPLTLDESFRQARQPLLIINTEKFQKRDNMEHLLCLMPDTKATEGPRQMITIRGTVHQSQTDLSLIFPSFIARLLSMRYKLHPRVAMTTNNDALVNFLSKYIGIERGLRMMDFDATMNPLIIIGHNVTMTPPWWQKYTK